jgi:hypothetical protein
MSENSSTYTIVGNHTIPVLRTSSLRPLIEKSKEAPCGYRFSIESNGSQLCAITTDHWISFLHKTKSGRCEASRSSLKMLASPRNYIRCTPALLRLPYKFSSPSTPPQPLTVPSSSRLQKSHVPITIHGAQTSANNTQHTMRAAIPFRLAPPPSPPSIHLHATSNPLRWLDLPHTHDEPGTNLQIDEGYAESYVMAAIPLVVEESRAG